MRYVVAIILIFSLMGCGSYSKSLPTQPTPPAAQACVMTMVEWHTTTTSEFSLPSPGSEAGLASDVSLVADSIFVAFPISIVYTQADNHVPPPFTVWAVDQATSIKTPATWDSGSDTQLTLPNQNGTYEHVAVFWALSPEHHYDFFIRWGASAAGNVATSAAIPDQVEWHSSGTARMVWERWDCK